MFLPNNLPSATIQRITIAIGNLLSINYGLIFGSTSDHTLLYQSSATPLHRLITNNEASWITGWLCLGAVFGSSLSTFLAMRIGPKSVLLFCGIMQLTSWFCIHFAYDIVHIYSSRIFAGLAAGGCLTVLPSYISEISEMKNRKILMASMKTSSNLGVLFGFVAGVFVAYEYTSIFGLTISMLFVATFPFVQESPYHFLRSGNIEMLEKSLRWFRGICRLEDRGNDAFIQELEDIKKLPISSENVVVPEVLPLLRVIAIIIVMMATTQFCGVFLLLNYAETIFKHFNTNLLSEWSAMVLAIMQFIGGYISTLLPDRINRKVQICAADLICAIALITLRFCLTASHFPFPVEWMALILLSVHVIVANIGICSLWITLVTDIAPAKDLALSAAMSLYFFFGFITVKYFYAVAEAICLDGWIGIFAGSCLLQLVFICAFVSGTCRQDYRE